jgi:hypothetical protein
MRTGTERHSRVCAFLVEEGIDSISFNPDAIICAESKKHIGIIKKKINMETEFKKIKWQS